MVIIGHTCQCKHEGHEHVLRIDVQLDKPPDWWREYATFGLAQSMITRVPEDYILKKLAERLGRWWYGVEHRGLLYDVV